MSSDLHEPTLTYKHLHTLYKYAQKKKAAKLPEALHLSYAKVWSCRSVLGSSPYASAPLRVSYTSCPPELREEPGLSAFLCDIHTNQSLFSDAYQINVHPWKAGTCILSHLRGRN